MRVSLLLVGLAFVFSVNGAAQGRWPEPSSPPSFYQLSADSGVSYLSMECRSLGHSRFLRMQCDFDQVQITRPAPEALERELAQRLEALEGQSNPQLEAVLRRMCSGGRTDLGACECLEPEVDRACVARAYAADAEREGRRCDVRMRSFSRELRRTGARRWTTSIERSSHGEDCTVTTVVILEAAPPRSPGGPLSAWTFRQSRVAVGSRECRRSYHGELEFSSRHRSPDLQCDGFGLP